MFLKNSDVYYKIKFWLILFKQIYKKYLIITTAIYHRIKFALSLMKQGYKWKEIRKDIFLPYDYNYWYGNKKETKKSK